MSDDMFFSSDSRSLRRGKRIAQRTPTCRPCLVWPADAPEIAVQGVVLDMNPYGMLIRMLEVLPPPTVVRVQLMRDDTFDQPLAAPLEGRVVRHAGGEGVFLDHGILLSQKKSQTEAIRRIQYVPPRALLKRPPPRMHTLDITIGDNMEGRPKR